MQEVHSKPLRAMDWPKEKESTAQFHGKTVDTERWEEVVSFSQTTTVELSFMSLLCRAHSNALLKVNSCV